LTISPGSRILVGGVAEDFLMEESMKMRHAHALTVAAVTAVLSGSNAFADHFIVDDIVGTFSACFGNDCVNGESFGFDTLRLKENNLRIHFQDTSNTASFPSTDWRIIINDSSNGGANYFGVQDADASRIPFRVEAGARNNALYVEADGDVGIGTSNPVVDLHVVTGNTPTLRLDQDGSSGFTPQIWDVAGNEAGFFVRDATHGSKLVFRIRPDAPTSAIDIAADGDIGMNNASPQARVHATGGDGSFRIEDVSTNATEKNGFFVMGNYTNAEEEVLGLRMQSGSTFNILSVGGGSAAYNSASQILFYAGGNNNNTIVGTERMRINALGQLAIATTSVGGSNRIEVGTDASNGNGAFLTVTATYTVTQSDIDSLQ